MRVSNSQHVAPRASHTTSLAPLESLVRALSNGARLESGGARGADFRLFENAQKHAKSAKSYCFSFRKCTDKFVIAHFKLENRSMSCTFQLICIASLLAFSTFILVFMQNCRDCRFSNSETTPMLPLNTRYDNAPGPLWPSNFQAKMLLFKVDFASAWYTIMHFKQKTHRIKP